MKTIHWVPSYPDTGGWKVRHQLAISDALMSHRVSHATTIVLGLKSWIAYAAAHAVWFQSRIGDDCVLGPHWAQWGLALRGLLNGETGDLDYGTLDAIILDNLAEMGFDENGEQFTLL